MKVILIKDVNNLGKARDIKNVSDGYARNYLFPNKLAKMATQSEIKELETRKKISEEKARRELELAQKLASEIDGLEVEINSKVGKSGKLYAAVTASKIANKLQSMGYNVKKDNISLESSVKELGEYNIAVNLSHGLESEIKLIITEEKEVK